MFARIYVGVFEYIYIGVLYNLRDEILFSCAGSNCSTEFYRIRNCGVAKVATWHPRHGVYICYWVLRLNIEAYYFDYISVGCISVVTLYPVGWC